MWKTRLRKDFLNYAGNCQKEKEKREVAISTVQFKRASVIKNVISSRFIKNCMISWSIQIKNSLGPSLHC